MSLTGGAKKATRGFWRPRINPSEMEEGKGAVAMEITLNRTTFSTFVHCIHLAVVVSDLWAISRTVERYNAVANIE